MARDIAPDLLEAIRRDFARSLGGSKRAAELLEAIQSGRAGYAEAGEYAEEVGRALSEAFQSNLSGDTLPDGRMYWNLADRVIRPLLEEDHALVSEAARQVQQQLNEAAGIGIKAQSVPLDQDRVDGILNRLAAAEQYDSVAWLLDEPVILFSRSVVDESVRRNAEFQGEAGLSPRIIRRAESHCCEWCARLAGTYTYPDVPRDVYRRHDFCRCVVEYDPGDGKRQTVHSGQEGKRRYVQDGYGGYEESREARIQRAQEMAATTDERAKAIRAKRKATWQKKFEEEHLAQSAEELLPNYEQAVIPSSKLSGYALDMNHPRGRAKAIAFRDVLGYTADNEDDFIAALRQGLKLWKASPRSPTKYGQPFEVRMLITGPNGNRATVKTGWQIDEGKEFPRLISAYIYND